MIRRQNVSQRNSIVTPYSRLSPITISEQNTVRQEEDFTFRTRSPSSFGDDIRNKRDAIMKRYLLTEKDEEVKKGREKGKPGKIMKQGRKETANLQNQSHAFSKSPLRSIQQRFTIGTRLTSYLENISPRLRKI